MYVHHDEIFPSNSHDRSPTSPGGNEVIQRLEYIADNRILM
jgi:hypothetical protein